MTQKMTIEYFTAFNSVPFVSEPSNAVIVEDGDGTAFLVTDTEAQFLDRIRRSKEVGRNLFFEECKPYTQEIEDSIKY